MALVRPPPTLAIPRASNSWSASGIGSPRCVKARAAAIDSTKDISAIPSAPGHKARINDKSGNVSEGSPAGMGPTRATPKASRPTRPESNMPKATATSAAGRRFVRRGRKTRIASVISESARVSQWIWPRFCSSDTIVWRMGPFSNASPVTFPSWPTKITTPMPALKPVSTGVEMKLAMKPRRRTPANSRKRPARKASVAAGMM